MSTLGKITHVLATYPVGSFYSKRQNFSCPLGSWDCSGVIILLGKNYVCDSNVPTLVVYIPLGEMELSAQVMDQLRCNSSSRKYVGTNVVVA